MDMSGLWKKKSNCAGSCSKPPSHQICAQVQS